MNIEALLLILIAIGLTIFRIYKPSKVDNINRLKEIKEKLKNVLKN